MHVHIYAHDYAPICTSCMCIHKNELCYSFVHKRVCYKHHLSTLEVIINILKNIATWLSFKNETLKQSSCIHHTNKETCIYIG